ncbi:MAG TPA: hypothetical protein VL096_07365 [Pirellulaceae bacterium]|nr:hypothetical protein [Pirellulaceae bacterium]
MILYRPVGVQELKLLAAAGFAAFPPRLTHQPIFYPVLNFAYAEAIARHWNTKDPNSGYAGFVTKFDIDDAFASRYPVQVVGGRDDQELWVPAEELKKFNQHILGTIRITASYYGELHQETIDPLSNLPIDIAAALTTLSTSH